MALERWQLCRNREDDNRRCVATKTISQPHAADGWGATYARAGIRACSVCVGLEPSGVAQSELITPQLLLGGYCFQPKSDPARGGEKPQVQKADPSKLRVNLS